MNNQLNQVLQNLMQMKNSGKNPQMIMQSLMRQNPNYGQMVQQLKNMANGREPREFITQLAKQNGADDYTLRIISQMFNNNK